MLTVVISSLVECHLQENDPPRQHSQCHQWSESTSSPWKPCCRFYLL